MSFAEERLEAEKSFVVAPMVTETRGDGHSFQPIDTF